MQTKLSQPAPAYAVAPSRAADLNAVLFGWWWLDSIAALALIPFLIKEARAAITGDDCDCC